MKTVLALITIAILFSALLFSNNASSGIREKTTKHQTVTQEKFTHPIKGKYKDEYPDLVKKGRFIEYNDMPANTTVTLTTKIQKERYSNGRFADIEGELKNVGTSTVKNLTLMISVYDKNNATLKSFITALDPSILAPAQSVLFTTTLGYVIPIDMIKYIKYHWMFESTQNKLLTL